MLNSNEYKKISILINYKPGHIHDDNNWSWVKKRYESLMPSAEICIGDCCPNNYSKSLSINKGAKKATGDLFIIADSNIVFNIDCIEKGIDLLKDYPFIVPFTDQIHISKHDSHKLHSLSPELTLNEPLFTAYKKEPHPSSSILIIPRVNFEEIGGFDESITEWYEEDIDFLSRLYNHFGTYGRVPNCCIWSLFHKRIEYPLYSNGINVERIHTKKYPLENMSWDIRI